MTRQEYAELAVKGTNLQRFSGTGKLVKYSAELTVADYDRIMEEYLVKVRSDRGYTTREPDVYINSEVSRWKQDALDWVKFRDAVMLYGLEVQNRWITTGEHPSVEEFKEALPIITWTLTME